MNKIVHFFVYLVFARLIIASNDTSGDSAESTFDFVNKARQHLQLSTNPNIIMVVGITGVGKSTLVHYVTGNFSKMIALEPTENSSEYKIYDGLDADIDDSETSTVSRTLVPEMNVDENQNVWYDCPGFADTRNETVEIAGTYLIKTIIENAKSIKFVLVVNYESVTEGHDRQDFDRALTRMVELILNTKRFENSVSLVVTKAPSFYIKGTQIHEIFADSIKNSTARFAKDHRSVLQQKGSNEKKIQLLDAFLQQSPDGDYPRIAVFWRPMQAGPLSEIPKMVDGRRAIRDSIHEHISYSNFDASDFGFPLTAEAKLKIIAMSKHTVNEISLHLQNIDGQFLKALRQKIGSIDDFHSKLRWLELGMKIKLSFNVSEATTLGQWTDQLKKSIQTYDITSIDMEEFNTIARHENNLNILKSIAGLEIAPPVRDLIANSSSANEYESVEYRWYSFLLQVFDFFASYEVQANVSAYNVQNLADWGQLNKPQGLKIDADNFDEFTKRFPGVSMSDFKPTLSKLQELEKFVNLTLRTPVRYECNGETLTVKGNFVTSSAIVSSKCEQKLKKINVYILSTFYVNEDMNLNGLEELKIYAPKWSILRAVTFNLIGLQGDAQTPSGEKGIPGNPGNVGLNGGNFFGFANEMVNGELLTVNLNGGIGGVGQDGTGNADSAATFQNFEDKQTNHHGGGFSHVETRIAQVLSERGYDFSSAGGPRYLIHARCCGATGSGGQGGLGGYPGFYAFIKNDTNTQNLPKNISSIGSTGANGQTPAACKTTAILINHHAWSKTSHLGTRRERHIELFLETYQPEPKCPDNFVKSTAALPKQMPRIQIDITSGIIGYKQFLFENMNSFGFREIIQKAYDAIESNPELNQAYSVSAFAMEANALEKSFYKLNELIDMSPLYKNLLKRIENYSVAHESNLSEVDRKVLRLLHTTVFGKATDIQSGHKSDLIIDIGGFLASTEHNINTIDEQGRISMVKSIRDNYYAEISEKIKEAINYIDADIKPEIDRTIEDLNVEMHKTINETVALEEKTIKEIQRKQELLNKLKKHSRFDKVLGFVKTVTGFVSSTAIPIVSQIANAINTAASLVDPNKPAPSLDLDNSFVFKFKQMEGEKINGIQSVLDKLKGSLSHLNGTESEMGEYKNISNKLTEIASKLPQIQTNDTSTVHGAIGNVLKDVLGFVSEPLNHLKDFSDEVKKNILEPFEKASNALSVLASSIEMFKKYSNNDAEIKTLADAINKDRETLRALMAFEDEIYAKIIPMINVMQVNLKEFEKGLVDKSLVGLDVQRWQIAPVFRRIQKQFSEFLHGFGSEAQVNSGLLHIDESINFLIQIYDRIQSYYEHANFANYISAINTADYRTMNVNDPQLQANINGLLFNLHANVLLGLYDRAVDGFKQAVFPYAAEYLDVYQLPSTLSPSQNDSMQSVIVPTVDNIKSLSARLKQLNDSVINEQDMSIFRAYFDSESNASGPFYEWKNSEVHEKVKQLFAGQKIYLLADIKQSKKLNAIKFNTVGLAFRSSNQTTTDRLNQVLKSFYISMTHMGESNYRCDSQFYTIQGRPLTIEFSFEERRTTPTVRNIAYDKLSAGYPLLSPYTVWAVQLTHGRFDQLTEFSDTVDIEMHGYGQYLKENVDICSSNLEKYYARKNTD